MNAITVYHNPRCSRSRTASRRLRGSGVALRASEHLAAPREEAALQRLAARRGGARRALPRNNEAPNRESGLGDESPSDAGIREAMAADPVLLQRPIAAPGDRAPTGRPPQRVAELP